MQLVPTSLPRFERVREHVRSAVTTRTDRSAESPSGGDEARTDEREVDAPGNLFHCPRCGIVYIDAEKRVCSQCTGEVEQVRSTLSCR